MSAQHSSKTAEHGTPPHVVEGSRNLMGGIIHLDPFSSALWNRRVRALKYYTKKQNAYVQPWAGNLLVNPPGGEQGKLVQAAWMRLVDFWLAGDVVQAVWVGFSLEQLASLQGLNEHRLDRDTLAVTDFTYPSPLSFPTLVPKRRLHYQETKKGARKSRRSESPTHASYVSWLPPRDNAIATVSGRKVRIPQAEIDRTTHALFADQFGYLGTITRSLAA